MHSATAIIGYEIYRRASLAGVKVMLCGQGADETIGGYHSYFPDMWSTLLRQGRVTETWKHIREFTKLNGGEPSALFKRSIERQLKLRLRRVGAYRALAAARRKRRERSAAEWYEPELLELLPAQVGPIGRGTLDDALKYAVETAPLPLYLRIEDRNSMAHSVEARLPFLDYRLVTLDFQLPVEWRLRGGLN
jgi:asparagine synthase (glutamine-hydrolysing)